MMVIRNTCVMLACMLLLLGGCANNRGQQEQAGMVLGGVLGGVLGSQVGDGRGRTAAIIAGTMVGASVGSAIGRSMDDVDRMKTAQTLETVRTGVPSRWQNPDSGVSYRVVPTNTYEAATGPCREYTIDAEIDGRFENVSGTACRRSDGSWVVQN